MRAFTPNPRRCAKARAMPEDLTSALAGLESPGHSPRAVVRTQLRALQVGSEVAFLRLCSQLSCGVPRDMLMENRGHSPRERSFESCGSVLDEAGRRILPFLVSFEELSGLHPTSTKYQQRTRVVSKNGECNIFVWYLHSHAGYWLVDAVRMVEEGDGAMKSPEAILQCQLEALKSGDIETASKLNDPQADIDIPNVSRAGKSTFSRGFGDTKGETENFAMLLRSPAYEILVRHDAAYIIKTCALSTDSFKIDVVVQGTSTESAEPHESIIEHALFSWTLAVQKDIGWRIIRIRRVANIPPGK